MKVLQFSEIFVIFASILSFSSQITINHSCQPSSFKGICNLEDVFYKDDEKENLFPSSIENNTIIRITNINYPYENVVEIFDVRLWQKLGKPRAVEMIEVRMGTLEIPTLLEHASFADNNIKNMTIEESLIEPQITYLDMSGNDLKNVSFFSKLPNLETLILSHNEIADDKLNEIANLTKLKVLNLKNNHIYELSKVTFPSGLTHLDLSFNGMHYIDYKCLHLAQLTFLNLERNGLELLDGEALTNAVPNLKRLLIQENPLAKESIPKAVKWLKDHNITYNEKACTDGDEDVDGVCVWDSRMRRSWIVSSAFTAIMLAEFVGSVFVLRYVYKLLLC